MPFRLQIEESLKYNYKSIWSITHLENPAKMIKNCCRVTRRNKALLRERERVGKTVVDSLRNMSFMSQELRK